LETVGTAGANIFAHASKRARPTPPGSPLNSPRRSGSIIVQCFWTGETVLRGERARKKEVWFPCGRYFARTIKREDASDRWAGWLSDPHAVHVLNTAPRKLQKTDIVAYIKQFDQRSQLLLGIFEKGTRLHVGFVRLDIDREAGDALVNAVIGEGAHRNRGATTDVFVPLLDYLFDTLGLY
jgi:RimJ/RimL family protein N-acetyltransferase